MINNNNIKIVEIPKTLIVLKISILIIIIFQNKV